MEALWGLKGLVSGREGPGGNGLRWHSGTVGGGCMNMGGNTGWWGACGT